MADDGTIYSTYASAFWQTKGGTKVFLPFSTYQCDWRKNLPRHKRLNKDGETIDNQGAFSRVWTLQLHYFNNSSDPVAQGRYPDDIEALEAAFAPNAEGVLFTPIAGPVTVQFESLTRIEDASKEKDYALVSAVFIEDFIDDEKAERWKAASASSVAQPAAAEMTASVEDMGLDGDPLGEIQDFCADLEGLANAPGDYLAAVDGKITGTLAALKRVEDTFSQQAAGARSELYTLFSDPWASKPLRQLRKLGEIVGSAHNEAFPSAVITRTFRSRMSIVEVAVAVSQEAEKLMMLNTSLPDQMRIEPGTPVKIFASVV